MLFLSSILYIVSGSFGGCKKGNDKKNACRITASSIASLGSLSNFSYNGNGKLNRISTGSVVTTFDYPTGNTIIAITLDSGRFQSKKIIKVNAAGLATNVRVENNESGTAFVNDSFEYIGNELIRSVSTSFLDDSSRITTFTWFNGNMVTVRSGGTIIESREYFTDKPLRIGDVISFTQFFQGFETVRTKNLVKFTSQGSGLNFTYEFGSDGNISSVKVDAPNGIGGFQDYQYECK